MQEIGNGVNTCQTKPFSAEMFLSGLIFERVSRCELGSASLPTLKKQQLEEPVPGDRLSRQRGTWPHGFTQQRILAEGQGPSVPHLV